MGVGQEILTANGSNTIPTQSFATSTIGPVDVPAGANVPPMAQPNAIHLDAYPTCFARPGTPQLVSHIQKN